MVQLLGVGQTKNHRGLGEIDPVIDEIRNDGMKEYLKKGAEKSGWSKRGTRGPATGTKRRGIGMSCLTHHSGGRFAIPDPASAIVMFNSDGSVNLLTGAADDGHGNRTVLAQIAAEELGVAFEQVSVSDTDTDVTLFDPGTHASRQTYTGGIAVRNAAAEAKATLLRFASQHLNVEEKRLGLKDGAVYDVKNPSTSISVSVLLTMLQYEDKAIGKQIIGVATGVAPSMPPIFGTNFAEVEVDTETGEVRLIKLACTFDIGRAINPTLVEEQIIGGEVTGIGYALTEGLVTKECKVCNPNFTEYRILRTCDVPPIDATIVESNEPTGAFGAKGVGEATNAGTAAAIANAVYDAVGVRVKELPITQEKVLDGLHLTGS